MHNGGAKGTEGQATYVFVRRHSWVDMAGDSWDYPVMVMTKGVDEMTSILEAMIACPRNGVWFVKFTYRTLEGPQDYTMPTWEIPCKSYDHAKRVVDAFDRG